MPANSAFWRVQPAFTVRQDSTEWINLMDANRCPNASTATGRPRRLPLSSALWLAGGAALLGMAGCARLPAAAPAESRATGEVFRFALPPDALGARDPQLTAVLGKAGTLAAAQKQPATILVSALGQDFPYLNHALWAGVPARAGTRVRLENLTVGAGQPYSVAIRIAE